MPNLYPQTKYPAYGYKSWQEENVLRNDAQNPKFQEKDLWNRTIFRASLNYDLRKDDVLAVYGFWKQMRALAQAGSPYTFDFFDFDDDIYYNVLVGSVPISGAGTVTTFDIPGNKTRLWSWALNGAAQGQANAVILLGTGVNGRDQIRTTTGATGVPLPVTISYTGHGCFTSQFLKRPDKFSPAYGRLGLSVEITERT